jgi:hypothetical protein
MLRFVALASFLGVQAGVFLLGPSLVAAEGKDPPPFLKVMEDNFSGKKNVHRNLKRALDAASPNWDDAATLTKQYGTAARHVGQHAKTKPEKGAQDSWAKLCKQFDDQTKDLEAAVGKKDKEKALAAVEKLHETCEACHENHR